MSSPTSRAVKGGAYAVAVFGAYQLMQIWWPTPAGVLAQGILVGSLTSLIAFGIALVYRANRIINFAQADLGAVPAALAVSLLTIWGWPYLVAIPISIIAALALGFLVEVLFIRRFAKAPRLILMVVTIGVAQILAGLGTAIPYFFGEILPPQQYPPPFEFEFRIAPVLFRANDLIAFIMVPLVMLALFGFLRYTSLGIAIRASAESADRASLLGVNVGRTQNSVWIIATVLATVAMVLRAGIIGLPLGTAFGPTILLRALAAAVIGRMERFPTMFFAAVGLGVIETAIVFNEQSAVLVDPVVFVVVLGALLFQRAERQSRVEDQTISSWQSAGDVRPIPSELAAVPEVRWSRWGLRAAGVALLGSLPLFLGDGDTNLASAVMIYAMIALSLIILTGWAGEISLGQVAFVAIGAAVGGTLNYHYQWDLVVTLLAAGAVGAASSVVIGLPALRIRGLFLAVSTMAFALATSSFLLNRDYFGFLPDNITQRVQRLPLFGHTDISSERAFYYVCLVTLGLTVWMVNGLRRSRTFRILVAVRENPRGAQAFGVHLTRVKLMAFAISGFFASMAGALFVLHQQAIGQDVFAPVESIRVLTMVVIGGLGSVPGALLGAVFLKSTEWFNTIVPRQFRFFFTFAGSGAGLIFVLYFLPGGLGSGIYTLRDKLLRLVARRHGIDPVGLTASASDQAERASLLPAATRHDDAPWPRGPGRQPDKYTYLSFPDLTTADAGPRSLLSIRSVDVFYGDIQVLFGVNLEIRDGDIIALLGTNGAGKSTVLRAMTGLTPARRGSVTLEGSDITHYAPHRIAAEGVALVPGGKGIFPSLTVAENLRVGAWLLKGNGDQIREATEEVLGLFPALQDRMGDAAANLSGGQQQMLTLAMAMLSRPRVLIIDELSLGLAPVVVESLLAAVKELHRRGTTVVLVEQSVNVALTLADTAYFMEKGQIRFHGPTTELLTRPDILRSVFLHGAAATDRDDGDTPARSVKVGANGAERSANSPRNLVLEARGISKRFYTNVVLNDLSFQLHDAEILGIIGPNGAGKTTLFDVLSGFLTPDAGQILFHGADITALRPDLRSLLGLARSFQDARLFGGLTVSQAIAVALDRHLDVREPIAAALNLHEVHVAERRLAREVDHLVEMMGLQSYRNTFVSELSTGTRRVVDLACQIGLEPSVVLFDEPSSGIAQRETEALGPLLHRVREQTGASLMIIEHDMPMLTRVSDRMLALDLGELVCEGDAASVLANSRVVGSYLGTSREVIERSGTLTA